MEAIVKIGGREINVGDDEIGNRRMEIEIHSEESRAQFSFRGAHVKTSRIGQFEERREKNDCDKGRKIFEYINRHRRPLQQHQKAKKRKRPPSSLSQKLLPRER